MISVLDLLKRRLGSAGQYGMPNDSSFDPRLLDMEEGGLLEAPLPPGLPDIVQQSIREQPSYGEGEIMAPRPWYNPGIETETTLPLDSPDRRENRLSDEIGLGEYLRRQGLYPRREGSWLSSPGGGFAKPFPSPLNQMLRRGPFALY